MYSIVDDVSGVLRRTFTHAEEEEMDPEVGAEEGREPGGGPATGAGDEPEPAGEPGVPADPESVPDREPAPVFRSPVPPQLGPPRLQPE
jgi:hypothetical protein